MADYTGKIIFMGIDVHKRTYSVTIVCEGLIVKQNTFAASPEALVNYCLRAFKGATIKSAYEAGFCGFVLHRFLLKNHIENIVVHPASIEVESRNTKKTDKRDSKKIAVQLAAGRLHSVFVPTEEAENRRSVSRLLEVFVKQRVRTAAQIKSLLNLNGLLAHDKSPKITKKFLTSLQNLELNEDLNFCLQSLAKTWLYFSDQIQGVEKRLKVLTAYEKPLYDSYRKVIGFGEKIARILTQELGDTLQFSSEEKLFSFCGLTPSERSSGEHKRQGHITRQGNPILRKALVQAAWITVRKDPYFAEYYNRLRARRGAGRAILAVARKLIGRGLCAIKKKDEYLAIKAEKSKIVLQENFVAASSSTLVGHP